MIKTYHNLLALLILAQPCLAQDIEPRRWSHLPLGANSNIRNPDVADFTLTVFWESWNLGI